MASKGFAKRDPSDDALTKDAQDATGLEVIEVDPETAWSMWDKALAAQALSPPQAVQGTMPAPLDMGQLRHEQDKTRALAVLEASHQRIANTIRTLWGYRECCVYLNRLIRAGGDGVAQARVAFHQDTLQAMQTLSDLHDAEYGPPAAGGKLGLSV